MLCENSQSPKVAYCLIDLRLILEMKQLQKQQPGVKVWLRAGGERVWLYRGHRGDRMVCILTVSRQHAGCDTVTRTLQGVTIGRHQVKGMWHLSIVLQLQVNLQFSQNTSLIKKTRPPRLFRGQKRRDVAG